MAVQVLLHDDQKIAFREEFQVLRELHEVAASVDVRVVVEVSHGCLDRPGLSPGITLMDVIRDEALDRVANAVDQFRLWHERKDPLGDAAEVGIVRVVGR